MLDVLPVMKTDINLYYFTYFYMVLYDFINCPAFVDIEQTLSYKLAIKYI